MVPGRVVVIGAGASGIMAAGRAAEMGADVLLFEKMATPAKKLLLSGKSRGNLTNARDLVEFIPMYGDNGPFLYRAFHRFFRDDLVAFFKRWGVPVKVERGGRIFPASDDARDVVRAFGRYLMDNNVELRTSSRVSGIKTHQNEVVGVVVGNDVYPARAVILATGGASYPRTGSSGDGYEMARTLGHSIVRLRPALVPLVVKELELARSMQGVSLKNVRLTSFESTSNETPPTLVPDYDVGRGIIGKRPPKPVIESRKGEMLFTHFGIGGPITLLMSLAVVETLMKGPVSVAIDLKPALDYKTLRARLQRDFDTFSRRSYRRILGELLPSKMVDPLVRLSGIPPDRVGSQISAPERERLLSLLKSLRFNIKGSLPISAAIVTAGGVSLKEIDPKTMSSRLIRGLYFCGEVMDIDANTGGFNLQAAFSTGYVAGEEAALFVAAAVT